MTWITSMKISENILKLIRRRTSLIRPQTESVSFRWPLGGGLRLQCRRFRDRFSFFFHCMKYRTGRSYLLVYFIWTVFLKIIVSTYRFCISNAKLLLKLQTDLLHCNNFSVTKHVHIGSLVFEIKKNCTDWLSKIKNVDNIGFVLLFLESQNKVCCLIILFS